MKTLADLKRKIVIGTKLQLEHLQSVWSPPVREVCYIDTIQFGCRTKNKAGEDITSYCYFPKAKDLQILDDKTFIIHAPWYKEGKEQILPLLKYTIVE